MSTQTELTRITNAKAAVKAAIEGKGVTVPDGTLLDGMAPLIESIEAGGVGVQSDWNQNDETAPDYIKNRPFYTGDPVETVLVEESTVTFAENHGLYMGQLPSTFEATVGETYKVSWDGTAYECTCVIVSGLPAFGNLSIMGIGSDTGEPFVVAVDNGQGIAIGTADTSASHTFSISGLVPEVVKIDKKYLVQPDWNQNDSTQPDYVKNRPFYAGDPVETVLVEESTVSFSFSENEGVYMGKLKSTFSATVGETYKVSWDGTVYECTCVDFSGGTAIGNLSIAGAGSDTGEPFLMDVDNSQGILIGTADTSASHTFSISGLVPEVVKIDEKYLPDNLATKLDVEVVQTTADTAQSTADAALDRADTAKTTADTAKTTADGCVKTNNSHSFSIFLGDNNCFSGSNSGETTYYTFYKKNATDTPITLSIGTAGGTSLDISVTPSTSPTVKITPPTYLNKLADIEIGGYSGRPRPQITGLGGVTMYSSTSGSTKKFKITVDDSGTLKATEVS